LLPVSLVRELVEVADDLVLALVDAVVETVFLEELESCVLVSESLALLTDMLILGVFLVCGGD